MQWSNGVCPSGSIADAKRKTALGWVYLSRLVLAFVCFSGTTPCKLFVWYILPPMQGNVISLPSPLTRHPESDVFVPLRLLSVPPPSCFTSFPLSLISYSLFRKQLVLQGQRVVVQCVVLAVFKRGTKWRYSVLPRGAQWCGRATHGSCRSNITHCDPLGQDESGNTGARRRGQHTLFTAMNNHRHYLFLLYLLHLFLVHDLFNSILQTPPRPFKKQPRIFLPLNVSKGELLSPHIPVHHVSHGRS